jgi:hypothetical protein
MTGARLGPSSSARCPWCPRGVRPARSATSPWSPAVTSARGPTATAATCGRDRDRPSELREVLAHGELTVEGRLVDASNATLLAPGPRRRRARLRVQADRGGAPAVGLPRRHPGAAGGRGVRALGRAGVGPRPTHRLARRGPLRPGHGPGLGVARGRRRDAGGRGTRRRRRPGGDPRGAGGRSSRRTAAAGDRSRSCTPTTRTCGGCACSTRCLNNADRKGGHVLHGRVGPDEPVRTYGVDHG